MLVWDEPQDLGGDESVEYLLYLSDGPIQTAIYSTVIAADIYENSYNLDGLLVGLTYYF